MSRIVLIVVTMFLALCVTIGCTSRYRKDLYFTSGEDRRKVKVVTTEYLQGVRLDNPYGDPKVSPGAGSCLVLTTQTRGKTVNTRFLQEFVQFDENLMCQIYLQLPAVPRADTIVLEGNGMVQIRGRYELSVEDKVFLADETGRLIVDSLADGYLYATLRGLFTNRAGSHVSYDGEFRARIY
ncbi:MAG: hypothetical protein RBT76_12180 [candidate division Zixibacteria bacterium]|jgi:hypothetical protein|nr:hypothetical protein [candidate division Zixibacteria bacterium]